MAHDHSVAFQQCRPRVHVHAGRTDGERHRGAPASDCLRPLPEGAGRLVPTGASPRSSPCSSSYKSAMTRGAGRSKNSVQVIVVARSRAGPGRCAWPQSRRRFISPTRRHGPNQHFQDVEGPTARPDARRSSQDDAPIFSECRIVPGNGVNGTLRTEPDAAGEVAAEPACSISPRATAGAGSSAEEEWLDTPGPPCGPASRRPPRPSVQPSMSGRRRDHLGAITLAPLWNSGWMRRRCCLLLSRSCASGRSGCGAKRLGGPQIAGRGAKLCRVAKDRLVELPAPLRRRRAYPACGDSDNAASATRGRGRGRPDRGCRRVAEERTNHGTPPSREDDRPGWAGGRLVQLHRTTLPPAPTRTIGQRYFSFGQDGRT